MICARCKESGANEKENGIDLTGVDHLHQEKDEEALRDRHHVGDKEAGLDREHLLSPKKFQL